MAGPSGHVPAVKLNYCSAYQGELSNGAYLSPNSTAPGHVRDHLKGRHGLKGWTRP